MDEEVVNEAAAISKVADAVEIAKKLSRWWFRGHDAQLPNGTRPLPRVFRSQLEDEFRKARTSEVRFADTDTSWRSVTDVEKRFWYEPEIAANFSYQAPTVYAKCPDEADHLSWLFLMQHFGAPTRLLDWTTSILVALYFAVAAQGPESEEADDRSDCEIWALDAVELTRAWRRANDRNSVSEGAKKLAGQARTDVRFRNRERLRDADCSASPLALWGPLTFSRLAAQQSRFTIHPRPLSESKWPRQSSRIMKRFTVDGKRKRELRRELAQLGYTRFRLYQDLDSLGQTVVPEMLRDYSP